VVRERSAKPLYVSSILTRASNSFLAVIRIHLQPVLRRDIVVTRITRLGTPAHRNLVPSFRTIASKSQQIMTWPPFPKRLQSALKALCCLAESESAMLSPDVARRIGVSAAETAKILQLLVWGGFIVSRRGSKGGFHLAASPERITMKQVIDFFMARHPLETEKNSPVMRALRRCMSPCQKLFGKLSLAEMATSPKSIAMKKKHPRSKFARVRTRKIGRS
jgi:DNA-binding IscR family transcriptional regulator